jgi:hypothetical protein
MSIEAQANELIYLSVTYLERPFLQYIVSFSICEKRTNSLSRNVFIVIKPENASIFDFKKISPFAQAAMEIFNFFGGKVTFGLSCIFIKL